MPSRTRSSGYSHQRTVISIFFCRKVLVDLNHDHVSLLKACQTYSPSAFSPLELLLRSFETMVYFHKACRLLLVTDMLFFPESVLVVEHTADRQCLNASDVCLEDATALFHRKEMPFN